MKNECWFGDISVLLAYIFYIHIHNLLIYEIEISISQMLFWT